MTINVLMDYRLCTLQILSFLLSVQKIVRTDFERTKNVFGSGNFEQLLREIRSKKTISAVVIGIDRLSGLQINTLQVAWGLPVYDRYMLVLQIFKDHAQSPEAKLQVALAEIHYVRLVFVLFLALDAIALTMF